MRLHQVLGGAATILSAAAIATAMPATAHAAVPYTVADGDTLWGIASANGISSASMAAYNGVGEETPLITGQTLQIPAPEEAGVTSVATPEEVTSTTTDSSTTGGHTVVAGETLSSIAAANGISADELAAANGLSLETPIYEGDSLAIPAPSATTSTVSTPAPTGLGYVPSPYGDIPLDPAAADSWNAMREESLSTYGTDLYPAGPLSGYRSYEQQAQMYEDYVNGTGALAAPPGTSAHETGTAVDLQDPSMRTVIDAIGGAYGWGKTEAPEEWWHVNFGW